MLLLSNKKESSTGDFLPHRFFSTFFVWQRRYCSRTQNWKTHLELLLLIVQSWHISDMRRIGKERRENLSTSVITFVSSNAASVYGYMTRITRTFCVQILQFHLRLPCEIPFHTHLFAAHTSLEVIFEEWRSSRRICSIGGSCFICEKW